MIGVNRNRLIRLEPLVRRVLIVDPNIHGARLLSDALKAFGSRDVVIEGDAPSGWMSAGTVEPTLIVTEMLGGRAGPDFVRSIRRSSLACRRVPVLVLTHDATETSIRNARDAGAHEFLRKPFSHGDLLRRLTHLARVPRTWVEVEGYVGPDRRRFNLGAAPRRRAADAAQKPTVVEPAA